MIIANYRDPRTCDIMLCGPSPGPQNGSQISPWREQLIELVRPWLGDKDVIIGVPEFGSGLTHAQGREQYPGFEPAAWEHRQISRCSVQVFWLDYAIGERTDPNSRPGFDTRLELGMALGEYQVGVVDSDTSCTPRGVARRTGALVIGMPEPGALPQRGGLTRFHLNRLGIPVHKTLEMLADHLVTKYYDAPTFWKSATAWGAASKIKR